MSKIIWITGASSGIGLSTALLFADKGWTVYAGTRNLKRDAEKYTDKEHLHFIEADVTNPEQLSQAAAEIERAHGRLDVLFCNAGFGYLRALGQSPDADIRRVFDTNVHGVMHTIQAALPLMRKSGYSHLVATTSVGGLVGQPMNEIYCASKFAVEGLLESLATYYKPFFNIDVSLLEPGAIATAFTDTVFTDIAKSGGILDDEYKPVVDTYVKTFSERNAVPQTADSVAEVMWDLVHMENKPLRIRTSERAEAFTRFKVEADPTGLESVAYVRKSQLNL